MVCEINDICTTWCLIFQTKPNLINITLVRHLQTRKKKTIETVQIGAEKTSLSSIETMILFIHDIGRFMHIFKQFEGIEGCDIKSVFNISQNHANHIIEHQTRTKSSKTYFKSTLIIYLKQTLNSEVKAYQIGKIGQYTQSYKCNDTFQPRGLNRPRSYGNLRVLDHSHLHLYVT